MFAITFITGCMCFLMGLLAELITRTYHESQDKMTYLIARTRNIAQPRRAGPKLHHRN